MTSAVSVSFSAEKVEKKREDNAEYQRESLAGCNPGTTGAHMISEFGGRGLNHFSISGMLTNVNVTEFYH